MPEQNKANQSKHWLNALLSSLEIGIFIVDKDFKLEVWNPFMQNHSGVSEQELVGQDLFDLFPELQKNWLIKKCDAVFELASPVFIIWEQRNYLFQFPASRPLTSDAEFMYQNVSITPLLSSSGSVEKLCFLIYDVTDQAQSKIRIEALNNQLETISRIDGLTQLNNRRYWQEVFDREHKLAFRTNADTTLIILDIDHFKKVNDTYGHQAGDTVIQHFAKIIRQSTRETDVLGRYGGEEFVVLLPNTNQKDAVVVAERIRQSTMEAVVDAEGVSITYTCSLGCAGFNKQFKKSQMWIEAADQALYKAKEQGRNQVVCSPELVD